MKGSSWNRSIDKRLVRAELSSLEILLVEGTSVCTEEIFNLSISTVWGAIRDEEKLSLNIKCSLKVFQGTF